VIATEVVQKFIVSTMVKSSLLELAEIGVIKMTNYEVIKKIMESNKISNDDKAYYIEMFLKDWYTLIDIDWIWSD
jgi:hypothetical protein